ncbi:MAG: bifunctional demethylmenaquinone methyltransferase/2-methoxy-6-polyprenyl-1,4-benzoquinol methylase UbiE [Aquiluna sp.]|nr:bifunctional demethylmenaquinone methyltransferase/2-methoxy-6-polyprenyl-1,4-benzoquinol methylase UbiE [Aquiluna sp.]MCF8545525.1 bifunctional demethylmenaquinone methyltransferase/2-methoxy-6-polyprenyl-1,4-benzoquinol methylase UbiE [Aquiluna sp.]
MSKPDLSKQPAAVSAMFDEVAQNYDLTNDLLSFGQSRFWRGKVRKAIAPKSGEKILDIAAGTGTSSMALLGPGIKVVAADFSKGMLEVGKKRYPELEFAFADAMNLPFKDAEFDVVTMSFGLRNVQDHKVALKEFLRVLKPEGRLVICEFSEVPGLLGVLYRFYLKNILPRISRLFSKAPAAYSYLAESISAWPNQKQLAKDIEVAGFSSASYKNLTFGVVALHQAVKK